MYSTIQANRRNELNDLYFGSGSTQNKRKGKRKGSAGYMASTKASNRRTSNVNDEMERKAMADAGYDEFG